MPQKVLDNNKIQVHYLSVWLVDLLRKLPRFLYLIYAFFRLLIQTLQLLFCLIRLRNRFDYLLIQNPPCLPLLFVSGLLCFLSFGKTRLVVDWHNYGYSILEIGGSGKSLVKVAKWYEVFFGKMAWKHLTVSGAMKNNLVQLIGVDPRLVHVVYDRATSKFKSVNQEERNALFTKIGLPQLCEQNRPALLLSSTSYTPDEDFMILVRALDLVDADPASPMIQVLVTGRGP